MRNQRIYLDHQATTPLDPRVFEAMRPYFTEKFGNPASKSHPFGWEASEAVERAREQVADLVGAEPGEIVFTSGATEAVNLAIKGVAEMYAQRGRQIVTVATEHRAVLDSCRALELAGFGITRLGVDGDGLLSPDVLRAALTADTILACVMQANNEIGVIQDIAALGAICREQRVFLFVDGAQSVGKMPVDVNAQQMDLLAISGHKLYGPKGIGALYLRRRNPQVRLKAQLHGGGHERGRRSGTLPTPLIVGLGQACQLAGEELAGEAQRQLSLRDRLVAGITAQLDGVRLNGHPAKRLAGNANLSFDDVDGAALLTRLTTIAVSSGSACTTEEAEPSHVLRALGLPDDLAAASIRFGLGRSTTAEEIETAIALVVRVVRELRGTPEGD
ncbi:MAG: aminotransferase class V-fold PLP-dependent enzyme [Candidatus Marinimicrobia bacterium]|nr:aminotransferase class V-fold PLP-dependent enzyme [Candidatus Neomarinimicrobiota bacterium]